MDGVGRRVMGQPRQRIIHALRCKGSQRLCPVGGQFECAVDDVIVHCVQVRHIKHITKSESRRPFLRNGHAGIIGNREMHRDWGLGQSDLHGHLVVQDQQTDLLFQIVPEQVWPGDRRRMRAGTRDMSKTQAAVHLGMTCRGDPDLGIEGTVATVRMAALHGLREMFTKKTGRALIQQNKTRDGRFGVGEKLGSRLVG